MPGYTDRDIRRKRKSDRERQQKWRAAKRTGEQSVAVVEASAALPVGTEASAVAEWAAAVLKVPPGHPKAGEPMVLPDYGLAFLCDVFRPSVREISLVIARKNSKSALVAVLLLAHLAGPVRKMGFRAGVVSLTAVKAGELKLQAQDIAKASGLTGVEFLRTPAPGRVVSPYGSVDILSSDSDAGAASGFQLAIVDEIGLMRERDRPLINGMRSSVSARDGKFLSLSVFGSGPFIPEILDRRGDPALAVHLYQPDEGASLDDESAWRAANPGLACGIKSISYMRDEARRVAVSVADQSSFRALDMNLPGQPSREMAVSLDAWKAVESTKAAKRSGPAYIGFDAGGAQSMSAAAAFWPESGRLDSWACFPKHPPLDERGAADGVGSLYVQSAAAGQLWSLGEQVSDLAAFLELIGASLGYSMVAGIAADRFRQSELQEALSGARLPWPTTYRSSLADHLPIFQRRVYGGEIRVKPSLLLLNAIADSEVQRDGHRARLVPARRRSRIDPLVAAIHAVSLAAESYRTESEVDALMAV